MTLAWKRAVAPLKRTERAKMLCAESCCRIVAARMRLLMMIVVVIEVNVVRRIITYRKQLS